ncbi:kinase-like domain-containing protein [Aspergillus bertholletiae]|uniref:non-specific serine/threonine protein kinase n=1 Tax=Aspergillus bertholletiae TaxID=1226010 RepID=A0A5N7BPC8_9EURO|nr:kinase-like domain-containing protein [Aspergillus bertholletiae]
MSNITAIYLRNGSSARYARNHQVEYNWVDGAESLEMYRPGGYHPIVIEGTVHGRYRVVDKLGFGGYSTVWLARNIHLQHYAAVNVDISKSSLQETRHNAIPFPLDEFELNGPNGKHLCYTTTPARCNLRGVSFSRLFPLEVARALSGNLVQAIAYMHSQGYANGDIHLRSILVKLPSSFGHLSTEQLYEQYGESETVSITRRDGKPLPLNIPTEAVLPLYLGKNAKEFSLSDTHMLLGDFGEAFATDLKARKGEDCHTPLAMRPPEARFEPQAPLSYSADIWSLAIAIWEILGMKAILQIDVLGPLPPKWWDCWEERGQFFDAGGRRPRQNRGNVVSTRRKTAAILDLMRRMLAFRPEDCPTAKEVLQSEWIVSWALPDLERRSLIK